MTQSGRDYQEGRGREGPIDILANFKGYLQSDGYTVYERFDQRKDLTLMHCMAHARRKFHDALNNDYARAAYVLEEIQKLYTVERSCKEEQLNTDEIKERRQQVSVPILISLGEWMRTEYAKVLQRSSIYEALAYSIKRWDRLMIYTEDGNLNIDTILWRAASDLWLCVERIISSQDRMKQQEEAECYTA